MTIIEALCIACSAGWAVAIVALFLFLAVARIIRTDRGDLSNVETFAAGVGGCTVEDRVCSHVPDEDRP